MADHFGMTTGSLSISGIFNNCLDCFDYVRFGRSFAQDYQISQLTLDITKVRISRWGQAINVHDDPRFAELDLKENSLRAAREILEQILILFLEAEKVSNRFRIFAKPEELAFYDPICDLDHIFRDLHHRMHIVAGRRHSHTDSLKKTAWCLYGNKKFGELTQAIAGLINDLEYLFPLEDTHQRLVILELEDVNDGPSLQALEAAAISVDELLMRVAGTKAKQISGEDYVKHAETLPLTKSPEKVVEQLVTPSDINAQGRHNDRSSLYRPLSDTSPEIRLLTLRAANSTHATIECGLHCAFLDDKPEYTAISYVWGDPSITENIVVEGCVLPVTVNLASALRHLRTVFGQITLWADAICINQDDNSERTHQIQHMRSIYRQAMKVMSFLGQEEDDSTYAIKTMKRMASALDTGLGDATHSWLRDFSELCRSDDPDQTQNTKIPNRAWNAIDKILSRTYWSRVWILQEVALASYLYFLCGMEMLRWDELALVSTACMSLGDRKGEEPPVFMDPIIWRRLPFISWGTITRIEFLRD
jgi:hypothetical protein